MFGDLNLVQIIGNITHDLEVRQTNSGTSVCSFSIATNRRYQADGEWKEETDFHNIVVWSRQAESLALRAKKGTRIYVEGRLSTRSWENDKGETQYKTEVVARRVILLDRYEKGSTEELSGGASKPTSKKSDPKGKKDDDGSVDPNDLPF